MATSNTVRPSTTLRLRLAADPLSGYLDGAWWPHSRDPEVELADLVDHFPTKGGHIRRVVYSRPDWLTQPRKIPVSRGRLKTGSFPHDDTHVVLLSLSTGVELKLLVVPPDTAARSAQRVMAQAAAPGNRRSGPELLSKARSDPNTDAVGHWFDDGGAPVGAAATHVGAASVDES